ncbi:hypothetical protein BC332_01098 [Capsicum chinense]|nr:hypothetical protein BC332_01098 [Capsicum chinense]
MDGEGNKDTGQSKTSKEPEPKHQIMQQVPLNVIDTSTQTPRNTEYASCSITPPNGMRNMSYADLLVTGPTQENRKPVMKLQNSFSPLVQEIMVAKMNLGAFVEILTPLTSADRVDGHPVADVETKDFQETMIILKLYGGLMTQFLENHLSDHSPIHINIVSEQKQRKEPFRFLNALADEDDFLPIMQQIWNKPIKGTGIFKVQCLKRRFDMFSTTSELKANLKKSQVFFEGVSPTVQQKIV